ncbi:MAG: hypothetical protein Q7S31_01670 [bacterium]|nr:hypothetical protein [bacterium]
MTHEAGSGPTQLVLEMPTQAAERLVESVKKAEREGKPLEWGGSRIISAAISSPPEIPIGEMDTAALLPFAEAVALVARGVGEIIAVPGQDYRHETTDLQDDGRVRVTEATVPPEMAYVKRYNNL